jgi:hypothetical protein
MAFVEDKHFIRNFDIGHSLFGYEFLKLINNCLRFPVPYPRASEWGIDTTK